MNNLSVTNGGVGLTTLANGKWLNAKNCGSGPHTIVFIHGLGGSTFFFDPSSGS